jgi:protein-tyrosine phosphatase
MATPAAKTVLFLCTGNFYRSRFAEILFNSVAAKMGLPWRATSRGLALERGVNNRGPISSRVLPLLMKLGIRAGSECSRMPQAVSSEELTTAERVIALCQVEHEPLVVERHDEFREKVEYWQVEDDNEALAKIEAEMSRFIARLLGGGDAVEPIREAQEQPAARAAAKPKMAKVGRETAGRRGKGVTTVYDVECGEEELRELAATLKQRCGTGGTVKDGRIEIQGDQRDRIVIELQKLGFKVKRVGG